MMPACEVARMKWMACRSHSASCDTLDQLEGVVPLAELVRVYKEVKRPAARAELAYWESLPTISDAVRKASRAERPDGKRHDHQTRIRRSALREAARRLRRLELRSVRSFHELHAAVGRAIGSVDGIGELMVYDTALRIGARLRLEPDVVYLHAGTRAGARALGIDCSASYIAPVKLPAALRQLRPHEVEDFLCIFKAHLRPAVS